MPVRLLSDETIGKIAAGEVVERPASVVKELLENALDAGARRVRVAIREGGLGLIEVADDGCGIDPAELPLAVRRHATSKLSRFEDLDDLATLGFRGEALPSIAAVADVALRSRAAGRDAAAELRVAYGDTGPTLPTGAPAGTVVTVRDLFGNVPARRKFLRQPATESAYIVRAVSAYAAARPDVAVTLTVDDRRAFATSGSGDLLSAAAEVWGAEVGRAALLLHPLDHAAAVPGVAVSGWVGAPEVTRSHRQGIVVFVNGRWVQNRALAFALEEAYHSLLMVGRHPVAMVRVTVDPAAVDVNVHPTKAEVKFADERAACRAVQRATHAALAGQRHDALPTLGFAPPSPAETQTTLPSPRFPAPLPARGPLVPPTADAAGPSLTGPAGEPAPAAHPSGVPILRVLGQIGGSFIIAEGPEGMYLIDQHAAHERVMYERILASLRDRTPARQPLLDPLVVDLPPDQLAAYERSADELASIGFEIEPFGGSSVAVRAIPALIHGVDIAERLRLILGELAEGGQGESWLDAVAVSTACHTSIRAGQALSIPEMRELVAELERSSQPRACGHGRPTMLHLTQSDLEKQFARR